MDFKLRCILLLFFISGCGIESTIPAGDNLSSEPDVQTGDQIVNVNNLDYNSSGVQATCNISGSLISPGLPIEVFIEYDGIEIERISQMNNIEYVFTRFIPISSGELRCVVEYASAEFESSISFIDISDIP